jgi:hypothetical protein
MARLPFCVPKMPFTNFQQLSSKKTKMGINCRFSIANCQFEDMSFNRQLEIENRQFVVAPALLIAEAYADGAGGAD